MKSFLSLLCGACLLGAAAHAQTTMPAIGASNPKGEVAKTDASVNARAEAPRGNKKTRKAAGRQTHKMKMKGSTTETM